MPDYERSRLPELAISNLWDGTAARPEERVAIFLKEHPGELSVWSIAPFHGDPAPAGPVGPTWALWEHEVVELFVVGPEEQYTELEVGPHGHYLLLRLHGRRNIVEKLLPAQVRSEHDRGDWVFSVRLPHSVLPPRPWRFNATAIHGLGAKRRYLSLFPLPGPEPDFHRIELFQEIEGIGGVLPG